MPHFRKKLAFILGVLISFYFSSINRHSSKSIENIKKLLQKAYPMKIIKPQNRYDDTLAEKIHRDVKVLCMILTHPKGYANKTKAVKNTWGKKCDKLIFMSSEPHPEFDIVTLPNLNESRNELWNKTRLGFYHVYKKYLNDYDFFMKADDDKYKYQLTKHNFLAAEKLQVLTVYKVS